VPLIALLLIAQAACGAAGWLAACRAVTVTRQACRYLINLIGKQLVVNNYNRFHIYRRRKISSTGVQNTYCANKKSGHDENICGKIPTEK